MISYLDSLKVSDLKLICKNSGIIGVSKMKKKDLIDVMKDCDLKGIPPEHLDAIAEEDLILHLPVVPVVPVPIANVVGAPLPTAKPYPVKPDSLKVSVHKWEEMYKKGKNILANGNAHTH
tara:strand:+ start:1155 stop:1514 length:360 start_codon:yes stop_codon:yes gene_type:complete